MNGMGGDVDIAMFTQNYFKGYYCTAYPSGARVDECGGMFGSHCEPWDLSLTLEV